MQKMCAINLIFAYKDFKVIVSENNADNLAVIPSKNNAKEILIYDNTKQYELIVKITNQILALQKNVAWVDNLNKIKISLIINLIFIKQMIKKG